MKKIAVLFGGMSNEYEVSLKSATSVMEAINKDLYQVYPIGITKEGSWFYYSGDYSKIKSNDWINDKNHLEDVILSPNRNIKGLLIITNNQMKQVEIDLIFPVMHGQYAEDGTIQGLIEITGIEMIGCKTLSSALCMDKYRAHQLVKEKGIKVAKSEVFNKKTSKAELIQAAYLLGYPLFVKPVHSGSSIGIGYVKSESSLFEAIEKAFEHDSEIMLEQKIKGFEVGCSILQGKELIVGEVDEIEIQTDFFDYEEKYNTQTAKNYLPARISSELKEKVKETAIEIYKILNCEDFARVDLFITTDNQIVFNEINTIPGFTSTSRFPSMLKAVGYSFEDVISILLDKESKHE